MENIRGRGRGRRGRGRGRGVVTARRKKSVDLKEEEIALDEEQPMESNINVEGQLPPKIDLEADITQLETPTFTTLTRAPPEPMVRLRWGHQVNLLGEKVLNPMIHCCDQCLRPVLIYGRMIPCKHVFCLSCAKRENKVCPRCNEKVSRVEQTGLGTVFMCTHGGTRYGNAGCRRTYLSQRDLQAHINHRHVATSSENLQQFPVQKVTDIRPKLTPVSTAPPQANQFYEKKSVYPTPSDVSTVIQTRPPLAPTPRSNLITVPLQEQPPNPYYPTYNTGYYQSQPQYQEFQPQTHTDTSVPPPSQPWPPNSQFY